MQTTTLVDELRDRQAAFGTDWLRDHPVMEPPAGFVLDPLAVGFVRGGDDRSGWFLIDTEDETTYKFEDGPVARAMVREHVERNANVCRIELWAGPSCLWAAMRIAT